MGEFVEEPIYAQLARIGKVLANPVRLRLLDLLDEREYTVDDLAASAGIGVKNTSAQLQQLRAANLVSSRKDGTRIHYRIAGSEVSGFLGAFQEFAEQRLADLRDAVVEHLGDPDVLRPVTAEELQQRLTDQDTLILDVRTEQEYAAGHVPGAMSLPLAELSAKLTELPANAEIIAYCQGPYCVASPGAVRFLREHGFQARPLDGGFARWRRAGRERTTS